MDGRFEVIVIGGGHAGVEAAWMAGQLGARTAVVTMPGVPLASAPCNPSVGGVGKGQVVREVDALGGLMGMLADRAAIQFRVLNASKGHAVRSTRAQIDKDRYPAEAERALRSRPGVEVVRGRVGSVSRRGRLFRIEAGDAAWEAPRVVVTAGTFLGGRLHVGPDRSDGGRLGAGSARPLAGLLDGVPAGAARFKTGTPPRLDGRTIDFARLPEQPTDPEAPVFHFAHGDRERFLPQRPCHLARTNARTRDVVARNKLRSPLFNGQITAVGARYCPSLEDKVHRYPSRESHHVFIEPEGLEGDSFYPSGLSTSLPADVQEEFVRTIGGLERARVLRHGHAVEYDVVDTARLDATLRHQDADGLYFAGQVNGTSGYEEAAGQGLVAGANAVLSLRGRPPLVLSREDSYIGVMVEDLVTSVRDEPYRLFTARCENRLFVREDNAHLRMAPYRAALGLDGPLDRYQRDFAAAFGELNRLLGEASYGGARAAERFGREGYGGLAGRTTLGGLLARSHLDPVRVLERELALLGGPSFDPRVVRAAAVSARYEGNIRRARAHRDRAAALGGRAVDWERIASSAHVSNECRERVRRVRPATFSQLGRIDGIRPATLAYVAAGLV